MPRYGLERGRGRVAPAHGPTGDPTLESSAADLTDWLQRRLQLLSDRWVRQIRARSPAHGLAEDLLESFARIFVSLLPALVGPYRSQVVPLWSRAAELFGTAAAMTGLAAGEVMEEFQLLREVLIRALYEEPPMGGRAPISLRELLHLNRAIDLGVTQASVTHTDRLFFVLLEGSGTTDPESAARTIREVHEELEAIRHDFIGVLGHSRNGDSPRGPA